MNNNIKNIAIIGFGPHAKRIYFPILNKWAKDYGVNLCYIVDIESKKENIENYLKAKGVNINTFYIKNRDLTYDNLPKKYEDALNIICREYNLHGVIISTEPLTHLQYANWALDRGLHILMDKPISTEFNISNDLDAAKKILIDYDKLKKKFINVKNKVNKDITFSLMAQRRFHPAFIYMRDKIKEVFDQTNCPITSIQTYHCDGQWRMPEEIVDQIYHPYCQGYGKVSHSGYHSIDIITWLMEVSQKKEAPIDSVDIYSSASRPLDFITQINLDDYRRIFHDFDCHNKYPRDILQAKMKTFGEIDSFTNFTFKSQGKTICLSSNNLLHNGVAQRGWVTAEGKDLYKGNGRIRQETHIVHQGPFQSIVYLSYQSKEVNPDKTESIYEFGGEYHLDLHVFRNDKIFPQWKNHESISIKDLDINIMEGKSRGHQEDARRKAVIEFLRCVSGEKVDLTSSLLSHRKGVILTSGIYQSIARASKDLNPVVTLEYRD